VVRSAGRHPVLMSQAAKEKIMRFEILVDGQVLRRVRTPERITDEKFARRVIVSNLRKTGLRGTVTINRLES
jgi:hypothetical protein